MHARLIDFQGIVDLDHKVIEELDRYLEEKESRLSRQILNLMTSLSSDTSPVLPPSESVKLSDAVEGFSKKVRLLASSDINEKSIEDVKKVFRELHIALWELTEVLEGCVIELFQQIRFVSIDRWHLSIAHVVHHVKDILIHRMDDLIWSIRRLESILKEYFHKYHTKEKNWFDWKSLRGSSYLDRNLLLNLQQTEKFLKERYEDFQEHYKKYMLLSEKVEPDLEKMKNYHVLALLDTEDQNLYVDIFRLLRMLEKNHSGSKILNGDLTRALKYLTSIDRVLQIFRIYYREMEDVFFSSSIEWKSLNHERNHFEEAYQKLKEKIKEDQLELHEFIKTMSRYRSFMLKNDPNPYVRSRFGFSEWIVGPEPVKAKKLMAMIYSAEELNGYFTQFAKSLDQDPSRQEEREYHSHEEIERLLHEMGQPLISRSMMKSRAEQLLEQLRICDEVGSPQFSTIDYVGDILSKAMRQDWKYHVLHEIPLFHQIYHLHLELVESFTDPAHAFRKERFYLLFNQITEWVEKEDIYAHVHEIELDMNDMKTYLQDFLASIQRAVKEKSHDPFLDETIYKFRQQLLEYRYLFGEFFLKIMKKDLDGVQLRNQFLFVDQYLESSEHLIQEL